MPSVTPPDGGYNYYSKALNELEEELKAESKRSRERQEEHTKRLETAHKENIDHLRRETEETIENVRKNANETIEKDRLYSKSEIDKARAQTYDKFGRFNGMEADALSEQFAEFKRATSEQQRRDERALDRSDERYEQKLNDMEREYSDKLEQNVRAARDSALETYSAAYKGQSDDYSQFRSEAEKKYNELVRQHQEELETERRLMRNAIDEARRGYERGMASTKTTNESRLEQLESNYADKMAAGTKVMAESRRQETQQLRDQLNELSETEKRYQREKGKGMQEAILQHDGEWRTRMRVASEDYEKQLDRLKQQSKNAERYYANIKNEALHEKDAHFTDLITRVNRENHAEKQDLEAKVWRARKQIELEQKRDRDTARATLEHQLHESNIHRDAALREQAKAYQETLERQRQTDQEKIKALEKNLTSRTSSSDTSVISPAADAAIRKSVTREYEKLIETERERSRKSVDSVQKSYAERLNETVRDRDSTTMALHKQYAMDQAMDQSRFVTHMQDSDLLKDQALRNKEFEASRQSENLTRSYSTMMEKLRREYEDMLQNSKADASYKMLALRQEAEFNSKLAQREFTTKQNDLIRDYNKKLADQKVEYETRIDELKEQSQTQVREAERRAKVALEDQRRTADQKLAQVEQQHKERERYLTENYEEQLEKVRRSNALLVQKKG